ncbi:hypothetical protein GF312_22740 [Candidatus Poribacteria bacterium]|nr:hypothetical protein [Candidatus Poribacteria bacterium]
MRNKRQKRLYTVSVGQIFLFVILGAVFLVVVFEIGVSIGKKRVVFQDINPKTSSTVLKDIIKETNINESRSQNVSSFSYPSNASVKSNNESQIKTQPLEDMESEEQTNIIPVEKQIHQTPVNKDYPFYTIQVGIFGSRDNAQKLMKILNSYEYKSWIIQEQRSGKTFNTVMVGRFSSEDEAENFGKSLKLRISYIDNYIVREMLED